MSGISIGVFDPPHVRTVMERLEREAEEDDRVLDLEPKDRAPEDVEQWLRQFGVEPDIAAFYAESVRRGHHVLVFEAQHDDDHFAKAARVMHESETPAMQRALDRWRQGDRDVFEAEPAAATAQPARGEEEVRVPVVEEQLEVGTRETERGGAEVRTHVEEERVKQTIPVREEHVRIERQPADRPVSDEGRAFQEREVETIERVEKPVVSKQARVVEEVVVTKEVTEREEEIEDTLRKTVVDVEGLEADDERFRPHYDEAYARSGESYESYRPAYAFGYGYGREPALQDTDYDGAEPAMRQRYDERHGRGMYDKHRDAIRHGWTLGRERR